MQAWITKQVMDQGAAESLRFDLAKITTMQEGTVGHGGDKPVVDTDIRQSSIGWPDPKHDLIRERMDSILRGILQWNDEHFGFALDPDAITWQYTRYVTGGDHYRQHCDCAFRSDLGCTMRKISGSILLSDPNDTRGGTFRFAQGIDAVPPLTQGELVLFASFLPHSVSPILKGTRESLVFWIEGPDYR